MNRAVVLSGSEGSTVHVTLLYALCLFNLGGEAGDKRVSTIGAYYLERI